MSSRWERLLDQRPTPLLDHLILETAKLIAADYLRWPLELEAESGAETPAAIAPDAPRPSPAVYREALRLARWDVGHALDAFDDYVRNRRYLEHALVEAERPLLLLLSRWLVEQLHSLGEHTHGRVNRTRKLACLEAISREVARQPGGAA